MALGHQQQQHSKIPFQHHGDQPIGERPRQRFGVRAVAVNCRHKLDRDEGAGRPAYGTLSPWSTVSTSGVSQTRPGRSASSITLFVEKSGFRPGNLL